MKLQLSKIKVRAVNCSNFKFVKYLEHGINIVYNYLTFTVKKKYFH